VENINMAGNSFGKIFVVTTFGESHGPALGCVIDGCPAGIPINIEDIRKELQKRRPNTSNISTTRIENDEPEILSGIFEGKTLGTPIAIIIRNTNQKHSDYDSLKDIYRPSHADWVWENKYGIRDYRGGGRSSGRETVSRVAAGAIAKQFLLKYGINIRAWTSAVAGIDVIDQNNPDFDLDEIERNPLKVPHKEKTNNSGGILGGISIGMPLEFKVAFKPTPSISKPQKTIDRQGNIRELIIQGRHDTCIIPRVIPVVEAMIALVLADFILLRRCNT